MSYGIVRIQKFTAGSVKGIEIHDKREKDKSNTNPDIDHGKSEQNYDLHIDGRTFQQIVKERISELDLKRAVRKDAIVMAQVLVTSDGLFFDHLQEQTWERIAKASHELYASGMPFSESFMNYERTDCTKQFFIDAYEFLVDRYGKENVVSATVHMDEKTPHMHFNFVPVTKDGRLSAKDVFSKKNLIEQQTAFHEKVGKKYGLLRGEAKENGKERKHLQTAEYKVKTQQLDDINEKIAVAQNKLDKVEQAIVDGTNRQNAIESDIEALRYEKELLSETVSELESRGKKALSSGEWEREIAYRRAKENRHKENEKKAKILDKIIELVPSIEPLVRQIMNELNRKGKGREQQR